MLNLTFPLQIKDGQLARSEDLKASIDASLEMLMNTPVGTVPCAPDYGFTLTGLRFENVDENQGTIAIESENEDPVYKLKMSGSSRNLQTFAAELNRTINNYELRLTDTSTVMTYVRQNRTIVVAVRGTITETKEPYEYRTTIRIWT